MTNALWAKCAPCGHVWPVAFLPMPLMTVAALAKRAACARCGATGLKVKMAGKEDIPAEAAGGEA